MDALQNADSGLDIVDVAYRAVMRLDHVLRDWSAAPSAVLRLQESTTRLHVLLVSLAHAQNNVGDTLARPNHAIGALSYDIAFTRSILCQLENALEGTQPVTAANLGRNEEIQRGSLHSRPKWVHRSVVAELQRNLDDSYQRLLVRLMALNVMITANTHTNLSQDYQHAVESPELIQEHDTIRNRTCDIVDTRLEEASDGLELRQSDNERKFEYLEHELSAIVRNLAFSDTASAPELPNIRQNRIHNPRHLPSCACRCHTMRSSHRSSRWALTAFRSTLGSFSLYFSTSNGRHTGVNCTSRDCQFTCSSSSTIRMAYVFPKWLYMRAVSAVFSNVSGAPELLIRVVRRIARECESESLIGDIERRDVPAVRRALQTRQYSVFDTVFDGTSMILLALMREDITIVKLLLFEGADVFQEDDHGNKPYRDILMQIYASPHLPLSYRRELERLMPVEEIIDATELPDLHKVVLGIRCLDICEYLRSDVDVAATDVFGRSALWYASCKGDLTAVQALLAADLPTAAAADRRNRAIHIASRHNHVEVLRFLLDQSPGVSIDCRTLWSFTPLMSNAQSIAPADDTALELIRRGADLNAHNLDGTTSLHIASTFDRTSLIEILVASGADIDRCDNKDGTSALATAIQANSRHAMMALLRLGADIHTCNHAGQGVGHLLGKFADVETMEILRKAPHFLARLDTAATDAQGKTAMQICLDRDPEANLSETSRAGLGRAFASLLEAIQACSRAGEVSGKGLSGSGSTIADDEDDDVFFEALETWAEDYGKSARPNPDTFTFATANSSSSPVSGSLTAGGFRHEVFEDQFIDTNKYRFPEHMNSNGTKATEKIRMKHVERGRGHDIASGDQYYRTPVSTGSSCSHSSDGEDNFLDAQQDED